MATITPIPASECRLRWKHPAWQPRKLDGTNLQGVATVARNAGGSGYTSAPTVVLSGGGGFGALVTAVLAAGSNPRAVASFRIDDPGQDYTAAPTAAISGGGGTGATANVAIGDLPAGSWQEFDSVKAVALQIDGESGSEINSVEAGSTTSDGEEYISAQYLVSPPRTVTFQAPAMLATFISGFFHTVYTDSQNRPATLREVWGGDGANYNVSHFILTKAAEVVEKGGLVMGSVTIQPTQPVVIHRS